MKKIFTSTLIIIISTFIITSIVSAATTISTEISTGGSLTVVGTSTLATTTFSGNVGIGTTTNAGWTHGGAVFSPSPMAIQNSGDLTDVFNIYDSSGRNIVQFNKFGNFALARHTTNSIAAGLNVRRDRDGAIVQNGDNILTIVSLPFDGTTYRQTAQITSIIDGVASSTALPTAWKFTTTGSNLIETERMRISSTGNVGIGISSPTSQFQVASSSPTATTSIEIGKAGGQKSCLVLYDAGGSVVYAYVQAGATTFTLSTTSCK